jgi:hypothetical protein
MHIDAVPLADAVRHRDCRPALAHGDNIRYRRTKREYLSGLLRSLNGKIWAGFSRLTSTESRGPYLGSRMR